MSRLERGERGARGEGNASLYLALGVGFVIAAVLIIATAGTPAAGLGFVIAAAALIGKGVSDMRSQRRAV